jgi:drug/metabolite transporter (DMT)-like permease
MLIGFIFWYKGLAAGGIAAVGQLQLQPFFGLGLSAALLHETVSPLMLAVTLGVVLCVVGSRLAASGLSQEREQQLTRHVAQYRGMRHWISRVAKPT